jgi:hypothetical protein
MHHPLPSILAMRPLVARRRNTTKQYKIQYSQSHILITSFSEFMWFYLTPHLGRSR